jgi:predicted transcriptional regulator
MLIDEDVYLSHYGTPRHSGRYPWGSGDPDGQRNRDFLASVDELRKKGLSQVEIARGMGLTTTQLRNQTSIARNEERQRNINEAQRLRDKGLSPTAIGKQMGANESTVRSWLEPGATDKATKIDTTASVLRDNVKEKKYIDVGRGVEAHMGVTRTNLNTSISKLKDEGYKVHYIKIEQLGTGKETTLKVLTGPDVNTSEVSKNRAQIRLVNEFSTDGGRTFTPFHPPLSLDSKRVGINYKETGGAAADGVIYVRPGVTDVSLGKARYAQVRIAVDGTHFIKGMAMYKPDLPAGIDVMFNTNKSNTGNKLDALKKLEDDPDMPFGSQISRQIFAKDKNGDDVLTSAMNIVNEEGKWETWSKTLSSQFLSKQSPKLAASQLAATYDRKLKEFDEIMSLTNPTVKKKLLDGFADEADSSSVHLKAAALPRQSTHVILPINSLKVTEVYAPTFNDGERVVLVRHPHGGIFEIPELTVNNRNPEAISLLGRASDAIGIHSKVAEQLSGADFDGDTVLVIPNNRGSIKTAPALKDLQNFDPKASYPSYSGMKKITPANKQKQMGLISNLITDMTIKGASQEELVRAVRHSMVVIDAEKHTLDYKKSSLDNNIKQLREKYQKEPGTKAGGASTLISRAKSEVRIDLRKPRRAQEGGPIDPLTGKKMFRDVPESYINKEGKLVIKKEKTTKLAIAEDAFSLVSKPGTQMETVYATHSNRLKALANESRKASLGIKNIPYSPSAKKTYSEEVASLNAKLSLAKKNQPLERQAQLLANSAVSAKRQANPNLDASDIKKLKSQELATARHRTGADKQDIQFTPSEWDAIQAGAISPSKLKDMLDNANLDNVKQLAMPRQQILMSPAANQRAITMLASGYTQAEVAEALGVSVTTLKTSLNGGG